jgi:hypothetical protein
MKKTEAVAALAALAQDNRLDVFRLLVQGEGRFEKGNYWREISLHYLRIDLRETHFGL